MDDSDGNRSCCYFSIVNPGDKRVPRRIASGTVIVLALMGLTGSGIVGKYIDLGVFRVLGEVGGYCVLGALLLVSIYIFYGIEWMAMLRKRNAYYQEMGEAYEVIRQEEDYTEPSYKVRPPKRRKIYSDHQMQSVNLQQMNEQIDRMQEKEQENRKNTNTTKEKAGKLEEILPSGKSVRTQAQEQESIERQKSSRKNSICRWSHLRRFRSIVRNCDASLINRCRKRSHHRYTSSLRRSHLRVILRKRRRI